MKQDKRKNTRAERGQLFFVVNYCLFNAGGRLCWKAKKQRSGRYVYYYIDNNRQHIKSVFNGKTKAAAFKELKAAFIENRNAQFLTLNTAEVRL